MRVSDFCVAATIALVTSPSQATMTEVFGGPGGTPFSMSCGSGRYLVGFDAGAGAWIDGVGLICASIVSGNKVATSFSKRGWAGGKGGSRQEVYCPPGQAVTALGVAHTRGGGLQRQYVNTVDIQCQHRQEKSGCISSGEGCGYLPSEVVGVFVQKGIHYRYDPLRCPAGEYATGIQGRAGAYVDAIGLICAPISEPVTTATSRKEHKVEANFDRPGGDYRNFDLATASPNVCRAACESDAKCKTYSYVKPGVQGAQARCWLKDRIPAIQKNDCCVSGVIRATATIGPSRASLNPEVGAHA